MRPSLLTLRRRSAGLEIGPIAAHTLGMAEYDLKNLQRDIDSLCESNRLDYQDLAEKPQTGSEKAEILEGIKSRNAKLLELLRKKWATEKAASR